MSSLVASDVNCSLCGELCKRAVRLPCCSSPACRQCAFKMITMTRVCWREACGGRKLSTMELIVDLALRESVEAALAAAEDNSEENSKKEEAIVEDQTFKPSTADEPSKPTQDHEPLINNFNQQIEIKDQNTEIDVISLSYHESNDQSMGVVENMLKEPKVQNQNFKTSTVEESRDFTRHTHGGHIIEYRNEYQNINNNSFLSNGEYEVKGSSLVVTMNMMRRRCEEFEEYLTPIERTCEELRYGAQLELLFTFEARNARCRLCGTTLNNGFVVLKHIQMKHKDVYGSLKTILNAPSFKVLDTGLLKCIQAEFVFAKDSKYPCEVKL